MTAAEFRTWYESRGLTQHELAELLGVPKKFAIQQVSRWATGAREVPPKVVAHLRTLERLERHEPLLQDRAGAA